MFRNLVFFITRLRGKTILTRTAIPGLTVQFSKDAGKTWHDVTSDKQIDGKILLATRYRLSLLHNCENN